MEYIFRSIAILGCNICSQINVAHVTMPKAVLSTVKIFAVYENILKLSKIQKHLLQEVSKLIFFSMNHQIFIKISKSNFKEFSKCIDQVHGIMCNVLIFD